MNEKQVAMLKDIWQRGSIELSLKINNPGSNEVVFETALCQILDRINLKDVKNDPVYREATTMLLEKLAWLAEGSWARYQEKKE